LQSLIANGILAGMASLTIRNLDDSLKERLRVRAAQRGRSMEDEARHILKEAVGGATGADLLRLSSTLFGTEHGVELEAPDRSDGRETVAFDADDASAS
jgi:antitoxin FitA